MLLLERREARRSLALFIELPRGGWPRVHIVCRPSEQRRRFEDVLEDPRRGELIAEAFQLEEDWTP
jgi:hypothetical protein